MKMRWPLLVLLLLSLTGARVQTDRRPLKWGYVTPASFTAGQSAKRFAAFDVLCVGVFRLSATGSLVKAPLLNDTKMNLLKTWQANRKGRRLIALVSTASTRAALAILRKSEARAQAIREMRRLMLKPFWQGVHLDIENVEAKHALAFASLVKEVKLHLPHKAVSVAAFPPLHWHHPAFYNLNNLAAHVDEVVFMMYDYHLHRPGPVTDVAWAKSNLAVILKKIKPARVWLGVPAYGYRWPRGNQVKGWPPVISEAEAQKVCKVYLCQRHASGMLRATNNRGDVYFLPASDLRHRMAKIALEAGLKGTAMWRVGFEKIPPN